MGGPVGIRRAPLSISVSNNSISEWKTVPGPSIIIRVLNQGTAPKAGEAPKRRSHTLPSCIWPEHIPFWNGRLQADSCQQQGQFQFVMPVTTDIAFLKAHRLVMIHLKGEKCRAMRTELTKIFHRRLRSGS